MAWQRQQKKTKPALPVAQKDNCKVLWETIFCINHFFVREKLNKKEEVQNFE